MATDLSEVATLAGDVGLIASRCSAGKQAVCLEVRRGGRNQFVELDDDGVEALVRRLLEQCRLTPLRLVLLKKWIECLADARG